MENVKYFWLINPSFFMIYPRPIITEPSSFGQSFRLKKNALSKLCGLFSELYSKGNENRFSP